MNKLIPENIPDSRIQELATAVCVQAVKEYKKALRGENRDKTLGIPIDSPESYEAFFHSSWFEALSGIANPDKGIEAIKKEVEAEHETI